MPMSTGNSLFWSADLDTRSLQKGVQNAQGMIAGLAKNITAMDVFGGLAGSFAAAYGKILKMGVDMAKGFEQGMAEVATISDWVRDNMGEAMAAIREIAREMPIELERLPPALYQIASASYAGAESLDVLAVAAKASVGGVIDLEDAVDSITVVMNGWKLSVDEAAAVADALQAGVRIGRQRFDEFGKAIGRVAPLAKAMGVTYQELIAAAATLTKQGLSLNEAITYLRGALMATNKVLGDGWRETMNLQEAFQKLYEMAYGSSNALAELTKREEADIAIMGIAGKSYRGAASDLDEVTNSVGELDNAFNIMMDTLENRLQLLWNNVILPMMPIFDSIIIKLSSDVQQIMTTIDSITWWVEDKLRMLGLLKAKPTVEPMGPPLPPGFGEETPAATQTPKQRAVPGAELGGRIQDKDWIQRRIEHFKRLGKAIDAVRKAERELAESMRKTGKVSTENVQALRQELFQVSIAIQQGAELFSGIFGEEAADDIFKVAHALQNVVATIDDMGLEKLSDFDWSNLKVGDWMTLANSAVSLITGVAGLFQGEIKPAMEALTEMAEKMNEVIEGSYGTEREAKLTQAISSMYAFIEVWKGMRETYSAMGNLDEWYKVLHESYDYIENWRQALDEMRTDIASPQSIADSIAEGFRQGKKSIEDFNETFEDMLENAIVRSFANAIVQPAVAEFYDMFSDLMEDGLTEAGKEQLRQQWQDIIAFASGQWEGFGGLLPERAIDRPSLKGAIKGITEDTAGVLAGQFNAIRMNTVEALSIMHHQTAILTNISSSVAYNPAIFWAISDLNNYVRGSGTHLLRSMGA